MVCVLSFGFLYRLQENLKVLIAFYTLDHLNKHFRSIVAKVRENTVSFQSVKGTIIAKINSTLLFDITIIFDTRNIHYTLQHNLHYQSK